MVILNAIMISIVRLIYTIAGFTVIAKTNKPAQIALAGMFTIVAVILV
jgi:hypothetical protein